MTRYAAVCIGGPADGKRVECATPTYTAAVAGPAPKIDELDMGAYETIKRVEYRFTNLYGTQGNAWIPVGMSNEEAILKLFYGYRVPA